MNDTDYLLIENIRNEKPQPGLEPFMSEFIKDRLQELVVLKSAVNSKDYCVIKEISHKWKGFCSPYGFIGLEKLSINLERSALESNLSDCEELIINIEKYLEIKKLVMK